MGHMPLPLAQGVARGVARFMALRGGPALAMNERHMRRVLASECAEGVEPDPALVRRWSRRTFDSYAVYWADGARLPYESEAGVRARWRLEEGEEHLRAAFALGRGIVMALPHVGSWEWGGYWLALEGMPMTAVVERLEPPRLFEWFVAQRKAMGLTAVALGEGSSAALLRALKNGEVAGLVSDRDLVGNGVEVEFFGERTTLPAGAATLALRTGAPLVPVAVYSGPGPLAHRRRARARRHHPPRLVARGHRPGHPGPGHRLRGRHPAPPRAVAPLPSPTGRATRDERDRGRGGAPVRIAMLSPYALTRPGGVQGQVMGLARSLRALGHDVTVVGPADEGVPVPGAAGEHFVIGRPVALHSNGSVAPVALSPVAAARAERFVRRGGFDVLHAHEPLAPMAAYGLVLTAPLPMVGTYHRAGVSRWVPAAQAAGGAGGSTDADQGGGLGGGALRRACARAAAPSRCCSTASTCSASSRPSRCATSRGTRRPVPRAPRAAQGTERAPRCVREDRAAGGPVGGGRRPGERGPAAPASRVGPGALAGCARVRTRSPPDWPGPTCCARRHCTASPSAWCCSRAMAAGCAVVASDIEGYRMAAGGHAALVPPGDVPALSRALGVALADAVEGSGQSAPEARKAATEYARAWSMDALAERYVDVYTRAIAAYGAGAATTG